MGSTEVKYRVTQKRGLSIRGMVFNPGDILTRKAVSCLSPNRIREHINEGLLSIVSEVKEDSPFKTKKAEPVTKWGIDPRILVGKTLQELNIMILEREPTIKPFESIEEAASQLTKDWKGKL